MADCRAIGYVNPASQHRPGQLARRKLEDVRRRMTDILGGKTVGMDTDQLILTSGGTESDNLAMFGLAPVGRQRLIASGKLSADDPARVLISAVEHPAILIAGQKLAALGFEVIQIPVLQNGVVDINAFDRLLQSPTALVSVMLANNETGAIQPVAEMASQCANAGVLIHTDAIQAVGKIPVDFRSLGVDALSFTAHKFAGPRCIGGLLLKHGCVPEPMLSGGFQQTAIRPGTEDVCLAVGMASAMEKFVANGLAHSQSLLEMRDQLQSLITQQFPSAVINSADADRTPQTLNLAFPGINRQSFLMSADLAGLAISTGSACASGSSDPSPVLIAMGLDPAVVDSSIRISFGYSNTDAEVDDAFKRIMAIVDRTQSSA